MINFSQLVSSCVLVLLLPGCGKDPGGYPAGPDARLYVQHSSAAGSETWMRIEQSGTYRGLGKQATSGQIDRDELTKMHRLTEPERLRAYEADALPLDGDGEPRDSTYPRYWVVVNPQVPPYGAELDAYFSPDDVQPDTKEFLQFITALFRRYVDEDESSELLDASPFDAGR